MGKTYRKDDMQSKKYEREANKRDKQRNAERGKDWIDSANLKDVIKDRNSNKRKFRKR